MELEGGWTRDGRSLAGWREGRGVRKGVVARIEEGGGAGHLPQVRQLQPLVPPDRRDLGTRVNSGTNWHTMFICKYHFNHLHYGQI